MNKQEIQETINELHRMKKRLTGAQGCSVNHQEANAYSAKYLRLAISALEHQLTNGWIPVSERLPEPKEWCWVWFDYAEDGHSSGNGFCERMYLSSNGKWMKNTLSTVKDEYMDCIRAWRPYFEPEPYIE